MELFIAMFKFNFKFHESEDVDWWAVSLYTRVFLCSGHLIEISYTFFFFLNPQIIIIIILFFLVMGTKF